MNIERRRFGFTLLELLVALSIIAILTALSVPSYQQHVRQARRADGQTALLRVAIAQERFRARCSRYADRVDGASGCAPDAERLGLGLSARSPDGHYRLSLTEAGASGFLAHAEPIGHQAGDRAHGVACNPLTIDQNGHREPSVCW
jgi:type IV pilus assembly protein PilE